MKPDFYEEQIMAEGVVNGAAIVKEFDRLYKRMDGLSAEFTDGIGALRKEMSQELAEVSGKVEDHHTQLTEEQGARNAWKTSLVVGLVLFGIIQAMLAFYFNGISTREEADHDMMVRMQQQQAGQDEQIALLLRTLLSRSSSAENSNGNRQTAKNF